MTSAPNDQAPSSLRLVLTLAVAGLLVCAETDAEVFAVLDANELVRAPDRVHLLVDHVDRLPEKLPTLFASLTG